VILESVGFIVIMLLNWCVLTLFSGKTA